jgi:predicted  nucleic acid-binding Zn-ribbon protein
MNNEEMKKRIEELEMKIRGLENDLDYLEEQLKDADKLTKAIVEIEEHLDKQQKGFESHFFPTVRFLKK